MNDMGPIIENAALNQISYGLFVLSTWAGGKDNACIVNTVCQVTSNPRVITVAVNRDNIIHTIEEVFCLLENGVIDPAVKNVRFAVFFLI